MSITPSTSYVLRVLCSDATFTVEEWAAYQEAMRYAVMFSYMAAFEAYVDKMEYLLEQQSASRKNIRSS